MPDFLRVILGKEDLRGRPILSKTEKRLHQIETVLFRGEPLGGKDEEE